MLQRIALLEALKIAAAPIATAQRDPAHVVTLLHHTRADVDAGEPSLPPCSISAETPSPHTDHIAVSPRIPALLGVSL
jgi:hypothetical protein